MADFDRSKVVDLNRQAVKAGLADGSILLVDVREPHEFAAGHIPGSLLMPLSTFDPAELPDAQGRRLVFSCRSGNRSVTAIALTQAAGRAADEHYKGGFLDWADGGEPVATGLDD